MMAIHSSVESFYNEIIQDTIDIPELNALIGNTVESALESGLYELCQKYSDIALNAPKIRVEGTCDIQGVFQFSDIDRAKQATLTYIKSHGIQNIDGLMDFIGKWHSRAVDWDDKRCKGGIVRPEGYTCGAGYAGKYYNFQELPDDQWEKIKAEVIKFVTETK